MDELRASRLPVQVDMPNIGEGRESGLGSNPETHMASDRGRGNSL